MDQGTLVRNGRRLLELLTENKLAPRAAVWVSSPETGIWRLWIVPSKDLKDKHEFYRRTSEIISKNRVDFPDFEISDIEFVSESHPAILALKRFAKVTGGSTVQIQSSMVDGFYLPDCIVLEMNL
ncbi:hypothetical protein [Bradyrhizobium lablabi]|uniref:hypothetical protein n=1 Tax=Bradyrhizobium lablabi TaxID=722472 RepID=UPI0012E38D7E|nr:hypothetical protein [Bradyrhizobium lablabi]